MPGVNHGLTDELLPGMSDRGPLVIVRVCRRGGETTQFFCLLHLRTGFSLTGKHHTEGVLVSLNNASVNLMGKVFYCHIFSITVDLYLRVS